MLPIRVNASYESELLGNKNHSRIMDESLEFVAFFLEDRPVYSLKKYNQDYLEHVESITNKKINLIRSGKYENWWGQLKNINLEKRLNSKETSFLLGQDLGVFENSFIFQNFNQAQGQILKFPSIAKEFLSMSGRGNQTIRSYEDLAKLSYPRIIEPLKNRIFDFSHYVFSGGESICYENIVDKNFKYQGTIFRNLLHPSYSSLKFYPRLAESSWVKFSETIKKVTDFYQRLSPQGEFSIDSYIYEDSGNYFIQHFCEVNFRKTMGLVTYLLSKKFANHHQWSGLFLLKNPKINFSSLKNKLSSIENLILLSPDDTRFLMVFLSAKSEFEASIKLNVLKTLLPEGEFSIDF